MDLVNQALEAHYGPGHLTLALQDIHRFRERSKAVQIVVAHKHLEPIGSKYGTASSDVDVAYNLVGGYLDDMFGRAARMVTATAWKVLVELGNVPEHIDAMLNHLKRIDVSSRDALVRAMNWVGRNIGQVWSWLSAIIGDDFAKRIQSNAMGIDWLLTTLGGGIKWITRQVARGLTALYTALRAAVDTACESMAGALYASMEAVMKTTDTTFQECRHTVTKTITFFVTTQGDMVQYAHRPMQDIDRRQDGFLNQFAKLAKTLAAQVDATGSMQAIDAALRGASVYDLFVRPALGALASAAAWIFKHVQWFANVLLRIKSVGRTIMFSTFFAMHILRDSFGSFIQEAFEDYKRMEETQQSVIDLIRLSDTLKENDKLSSATRERLTRASNAAKASIDGYRAHRERAMDAKATQADSVQFQTQEDTAECLADLLVYNEIRQPKKVDRIFQARYGQSLVEQMDTMHELYAYMDAQVLLAYGEIRQSALIGSRTKPAVVKAEPEPKEKEEADEKPKATYELQQEFRLADEAYQRAKANMESIDETFLRKRDATYLKQMEDFEREYDDIFGTEGTPSSKALVVRDKNIQTLARAFIGLTQEQTGAEKYVSAAKDLIDALRARNRIAKQLGPRMESITWKKSLSGIFIGLLFVSAGLLYFIWRIFGESNVASEALAQGWFSLARNLQGAALMQKIWNTATLSGVNVFDAYSPQLWGAFAMRFTNMDAGLALEIPKMMQYGTVVIGTAPGVLAALMAAFSALMICTCIIIDWRNQVALEVSVKKSKTKELVYSPAAYFRTYTPLLTNALGAGIIYAGTRVINTSISIAQGSVESLGEMAAGVPGLIAAGANPLGMVTSLATKGIAGMQANLNNLQSALGNFDLTLLLPPKHVRDVVLPLTPGQFDDDVPRLVTLIQALQDLPDDHPLLTDALVLQKYNQDARAAVQRRNTTPQIEEVPDDDEVPTTSRRKGKVLQLNL